MTITGRMRYVAAAALLAAACGDGGGGTEPTEEPVAAVSVSPAEMQIVAGATERLAARATDAAGAEITGRAAVWLTSDTAVVTVDATGAVLARRAGEAVVRASIGGRTGEATVRVIAQHPAPAVSALAPAFAAAGSPAFTLTITGEGFTTASRVRWNGAERATEYVSPTTLRIAVSAADVANASSIALTVASPQPGGGVSAPLPFAVVAGAGQNPVPSPTSLVPAAVAAGGPATTLTVRGTGFRPGARVYLNGFLRPTELVADTALRAVVPPEMIAVVGAVEVKVVNVGPGGGAAAPLSLAVVTQTDPVAAVFLNLPVAVTRVGGPVVLEATTTNGDGAVVEGRYVVWTSDDHRVATVDGRGFVTAVGRGTATITATSEGRTATSVVVVAAEAYDLLFDRQTNRWFHRELRLGQTAPGMAHNANDVVSEPSASGDGRVAYTLVRGNARDVAVSLPGPTYALVTTDGVSDQPSINAAGTRIAFRSSRGGRDDVWTAAPDGSGAVNLTAGLPAGSAASHPAFSPDGTRILFSLRTADGARRVWVMDADGTDARAVTAGEGEDSEPAWSPDGRELVFTRKTVFGLNLHRQALDGGASVALTATGQASMPAWSPDGRWIAFAHRQGTAGLAELAVVRPDGSDRRVLYARLPGGGGGGLHPAWAPRP